MGPLIPCERRLPKLEISENQEVTSRRRFVNRDYGRPFRHFLVTLSGFDNFMRNEVKSRPFVRGAQPPTREGPQGPDRARRVGRGMGGRTNGPAGTALLTTHSRPCRPSGARFAVRRTLRVLDLPRYWTPVLPTRYTLPVLPTRYHTRPPTPPYPHTTTVHYTPTACTYGRF